MNLAKVEQYFADFLSFLETRRYVQENGKVLFEDLKTNFKFPENTPLSEAIIMSCFHINPENLFRPIKDYREDIFSRLWKNQFYSGRESNWTAQFRTEINQKDVDGNPSRLAGKLLLGGDGEYRLQDNENLSESLINELFVIKSRYDNLISQLFTISQKKIKLHTQGVLKTYDEMPDFVEGESLIIDGSQKKYYIPSEIEIPLNLFVVGTVNMDETTHMFSPKVLDRANVIEMNEIDLHAITNNPDHIEKNVISDDNFYFLDEIPGLKINLPTIAHTREFSERYPEQFNDLFEINKSLKQINRHFGYRVYNEISNYILNAINLSIPENIVVSTDIQILQKILPKLHGSFQQLYNPLMKIFCLCYNEVPAILVGKESFDEMILDNL
jgi:ribosomal protein S17E